MCLNIKRLADDRTDNLIPSQGLAIDSGINRDEGKIVPIVIVENRTQLVPVAVELSESETLKAPFLEAKGRNDFVPGGIVAGVEVDWHLS